MVTDDRMLRFYIPSIVYLFNKYFYGINNVQSAWHYSKCFSNLDLLNLYNNPGYRCYYYPLLQMKKLNQKS